MKLRSYKIISRKDGGQVFTLIANSEAFSLEKLNYLFQNGMDVVVTDQRSALVKGKNYDVK